jgi:putative ABC transport system permease protein
LLALLLVHVNNRRRSDGRWIRSDAAGVGIGLALAVAAALLAGVYPAWRASRVEPGAALRED